jgi:hypothetical protein
MSKKVALAFLAGLGIGAAINSLSYECVDDTQEGSEDDKVTVEYDSE